MIEEEMDQCYTIVEFSPVHQKVPGSNPPGPQSPTPVEVMRQERHPM